MATMNGAAFVAFVVRLSEPSTTEIRVPWRTEDGSGHAGTDYKATSGTAIFAPGEVEAQLQVEVYGRSPQDSTEDRTFLIRLDPPVDAILENATAECTITVVTLDSGATFTQVYLPAGPRGRPGNKGNDGLNDYELAQLNGFVGTLSQWLETITARNIELISDGINIKWRPVNTPPLAWTNLVALADLKGAPGEPGGKGEKGDSLVNRGDWVLGTVYNPGDYVAGSSSVGNVQSLWFLRGTEPLTSMTAPKGDLVHWMELQGRPGIQGEPGDDGREVQIRRGLTAIQQRYTGEDDTAWRDIVELDDLKVKGDQGDKGDSLVNRGNWVTGTTYQPGSYVAALSSSSTTAKSLWFLLDSVPYVSTATPKTDPAHWLELQPPQGAKGDDGRELVLRKTATAIQWQYEGDAGWTDLVLLDDLKVKGDKGDSLVNRGNWATGTTYQPGSYVAAIATNSTTVKSLYFLLDDVPYVSNTTPKTDLTHWLELQPPQGAKGDDGRELQLQAVDRTIQYRYEGDTAWTDLITIPNAPAYAAAAADLDTVTPNDQFTWDANTANLPVAGTTGRGFSLNTDENNATQVAFINGTGAMYGRWKVGGVWSAWTLNNVKPLNLFSEFAAFNATNKKQATDAIGAMSNAPLAVNAASLADAVYTEKHQIVAVAGTFTDHPVSASTNTRGILFNMRRDADSGAGVVQMLVAESDGTVYIRVGSGGVGNWTWSGAAQTTLQAGWRTLFDTTHMPTAVQVGALSLRGGIPSGSNINSFGPTSAYTGAWGQSSISATAADVANGYPVAERGVLEVFNGGRNNGTQRYTTDGGRIFIRFLNAAWNGTDGPWVDWIEVGGLSSSKALSSAVTTLSDPVAFAQNVTYVLSGTRPDSPAGLSVGQNNALIMSVRRSGGTIMGLHQTLFTTIGTYERYGAPNAATNWTSVSWYNGGDANGWRLVGADALTAIGLGVASQGSASAFDWQQADFFSGQIQLANVTGWLNAPPELKNPAGDIVAIDCLIARTTSNRFVVRITSQSPTGIYRYDHTVVIVGAKGSRTFTVSQNYNSDPTTLIPLANGGLGANTPAGGRKTLGFDDMGLGLTNQPSNPTFDWQQFEPLSGGTYAANTTTWANTPAALKYVNGASVVINCVMSLNGRYVLRVNSLSTRQEYLVTTNGAKGSRTFEVMEVFTGSPDCVIPITNGGTGQKTLADLKAALGINPTFLDAVADLNTALANGNFAWSNTSTNTPVAASYGRGFTIASSATDVTQVGIINSTGKRYIRFMAGGTWGAWQDVDLLNVLPFLNYNNVGTFPFPAGAYTPIPFYTSVENNGITNTSNNTFTVAAAGLYDFEVEIRVNGGATNMPPVGTVIGLAIDAATVPTSLRVGYSVAEAIDATTILRLTCRERLTAGAVRKAYLFNGGAASYQIASASIKITRVGA